MPNAATALADSEPETEQQIPDIEAGVDLRKLSPTDATRLLEVLFTAMRHGALVVARRGPMIVIRPQKQAPQAIAVAIRRTFSDLGPTFIKFGQLIASSPGLFPEVLSNECRKLLDQVPSESSRRVRRLVERELGGSISELFAEFDDTPLAAASIAQVHKAVLHDGTVVAVKVRRPRLKGRIERDLRLLRLLAGILQRAGTIGEMANPVAIVEDFAVNLRAEIDFRNEALWMVEFADNLNSFGNNPNVVVPVPIDGMVARRVLVMTFIDGTPVDNMTLLREQGHDLEEILQLTLRAWFEGALQHGLFHGDVHAGNLFVTPDSRIAFLDFGIMGRLSEGSRGVFKEVLPAVLFDGDFKRVVQAFFELGAATKPIDMDAAAADVEALARPLMKKSLAEISYGEILSQVLKVGTRYKVRLPREMVLLTKQLLYFERYAKEMAPDYHIMADPRIMEFVLNQVRG